MDESEKQNLIDKLIKAKKSYHCYFISKTIFDSDLENVTIDYNNDIDKQLVNVVFSRIIMAISGYYYYGECYKGNKVFAYSLLKYFIDKISTKANKLFTIEVCPSSYKVLQIHVKIGNKDRYYCFDDDDSFVEIASHSLNFKKFKDKYDKVEKGFVKFLTLTEMR